MVEMPDEPNHGFPGGHSKKRGGHPQGLFQWKSEEHRLHSGPGLEMDSRKMFYLQESLWLNFDCCNFMQQFNSKL